MTKQFLFSVMAAQFFSSSSIKSEAAEAVLASTTAAMHPKALTTDSGKGSS
jgi:hypothetical protein